MSRERLGGTHSAPSEHSTPSGHSASSGHSAPGGAHSAPITAPSVPSAYSASASVQGAPTPAYGAPTSAHGVPAPARDTSARPPRASARAHAAPARSGFSLPSLLREAFTPGAGDRPDLPRHRRAVRGRSLLALGITAGLAAVALLVSLPWVAACLLGALAVGLLWVAARMHRNSIAVAGMLAWWSLTAPLVGLLAGLGTRPTDSWLQFTQTTSCVFLTGALVGVAAVLASRAPWLTLVVCWLINTTVAGVLGAFFPGYGLLAAWLLTAAYLAWRAGAIATLAADTAERMRVSRLYDRSTGEQRVIVDRLTELPRQATVVHRVTVPRDFGARLDFDAYVISPTGTYGVLSCDAIGRLRLNLSANRRVSVEGRGLDDLLLDVAVSAYAASDALRVQVVPLVAMVGATFPQDYPGVVPATVAPREVESPIDVVMLDPDLLVDRILYGETIYTANQLMMIAQRIKSVLQPTETTNRSPLGLPLDRPAPVDPSVPQSATNHHAAGQPTAGQPHPSQHVPTGQAPGQPTGTPAAGPYTPPGSSPAPDAIPATPPAPGQWENHGAPSYQRQETTAHGTGGTTPTSPWSNGPGATQAARPSSWSTAQPPAPPAPPATPPQTNQVRGEAMAAGSDQTERVLGPGVEVMWFDSVGAWSGWVCVTGILRLGRLPYGISDSGLSIGDEVVWVVAKTEWQRAVAERRAVTPSLAQPVRAQTLHIV